MIQKLGTLGTLASIIASLGCCVGLLGPVVPTFLLEGALDRVPIAWRLPLLYGSLSVALLSFVLRARRHRRLGPLLLLLLGAVALLYPLHEALDVSIFQGLVWLGLVLIVSATAWDAWLAPRSRLPLASASAAIGA